MVTGADRIAANGDTANKIGTYGLAVLARHHGIPFVVVAPTSTSTQRRRRAPAIPIEERDAGEVTEPLPRPQSRVRRHAGELIEAIVTEQGVHRAPYVETLPGRRR